MIKKYLYESLRLWVVIGSFVFTYNEAWGFEIDGISYSVSGCTAQITACYSSKKEIVLPDSVDYKGKKYPVTKMTIRAFAQKANLEKIKLPKSIISIGDQCFYYCTSLKSVTLSDSLATIGQSAFSGCSVLDSLTLPNSLTNIGHEAFSYCKGLGAVILPDSITWIGKYAFRGCTNLAYIRLPKKLRTIYEYAFADCSSLKKLEIPNGVETISEGCLLGCINLEELVIPFVGSSKNLKSPSRTSLFGILFGSTGRDSCTLTSQYYGKGREMFYIPNKLSKVIVTGNSNLYYAFYGCSNIKEIVLRDISYIGPESFYNCSGLTSLALPESLTTIESGAFAKCSNLKKLEIPYGVESIGERCLDGCKSLEELVIPFVGTAKNPQGPSKNTLLGTLFGTSQCDGCIETEQRFRSGSNSEDLVRFYIPEKLSKVTVTGNSNLYYTFSNCGNIKEINIRNVSLIGERTFYGCSGLTNLNLPETLTAIGDRIFDGCSSLTSVTFPESLNCFGDNCFQGWSGLTSLTLPDSLTTIKSYAFSGCSGLTSLTLPESLTTIKSYAFSGCSGLTSLTLPESLTTIESHAFNGCTGLTSLTLPKSLITIKGAAFYGCSGLTSVKLPENLSEIGERAFYGCSSLKKLEIPSAIESIGNSCLDGCKSLEELVIPFIGTEKAPKGPSMNTLLGTLFGERRYEGCIEIQQYFKAGGNPQPLTFYIPEKLSRVTVTGNSDLYYAFYNCCNIKEINLSNTCFIGEKTFYGCSGLTNLTLPESLTTIGASAFQGCSALKSIVIPRNVSSIYRDAFSNCTGLKTVKLKTSRFLNNTYTLEKIFENCVQEYVFDVESLTTNSVYGISNLSRVTVGQSCKTIEKNAFYRATIDTLWISKDIAYIGNQNVTVGHFFYQGSEAYWDRVVNESELEPDEFGIPSIFERDGVKYGIEPNSNSASVIKAPNTAKVYICSKLELSGEEFRIISIADNAFKDCTAIDTIFYEGNKVQWEKMIVGKHNDILQEIPIVYNYKKTEEDAALGDCYVYLNSCTLKKEKDQELAISMKNTEAITALQFELMLPDGFSVTQNTDGLYKADISTDRSSSTQHDIVEVKKMASNRYLILCSSTTNKTFVGNDGTVISLYIDVNENVTDGDYSFVLKNITLACDNGDVFRTNEINAPVVIHSDIRGDVNNDQEVNIGDISCIANIVLGDIADSYNLKAADVNLDGDINVGDVAYTAEYIINGSFPNTTYKKNLYMLPNNMPMLSVPDFEMQTGNDHGTTISLTSNGDITAFQFDMELPKGLRIKREFGKECIVPGKHISDSHILEWAQQENTDMRFMGYSLSNIAFNKGIENLISIELVADKDIMSGVYPIVLKNIVLATKTQTVKLYDQIVYVSVNQTTSINNIIDKSTTEDVFNIQGIKLQNRQRGINIINRKKVLIK